MHTLTHTHTHTPLEGGRHEAGGVGLVGPLSTLSALLFLTEMLPFAAPQATEDYRFDYKLYALCKDDVLNVCDDVEAGQNREIECLVSGEEWEREEEREEQEETCIRARNRHALEPFLSSSACPFIVLAAVDFRVRAREAHACLVGVPEPALLARQEGVTVSLTSPSLPRPVAAREAHARLVGVPEPAVPHGQGERRRHPPLGPAVQQVPGRLPPLLQRRGAWAHEGEGKGVEACMHGVGAAVQQVPG